MQHSVVICSPLNRHFKKGHTALEYYQQYKKHCGRRKILLPAEQQSYIKEKVTQEWTPHTIVGRKEIPIGCFMRTLYRLFKEKVFDETTLPMKGKRKPNGHRERRGKQAFKRNISEREADYPTFVEELGYI